MGIEIPDEQEDEVEKFREFLDQISPEDFGAGSGSGGTGLTARRPHRRNLLTIGSRRRSPILHSK